MNQPSPILGLLLLAALATLPPLQGQFRAGAALTDVTPVQLPVLVNGGMLSRTADKLITPLHARSICLADGQTELAIVVVDSCMMPRPLLDEAKALASERTGIRPDRILIGATHTHTAPSCMGCLGTDEDPAYVPFLREKLAQSVASAQAHLEPAEAGIAIADAGDYTAVRRWIRRPDRLAEDPFGNFTVRANMHAGRIWDDVVGESGPKDPDLALVSFRARDGRPLAVLANFSMHYFGHQALSSDYFGLYADTLKERLAPDTPQGKAPFVAMMSHGCSGDVWRRDYRKPEGQRGEDMTIEQYASDLAAISVEALATISYRPDIALAMAETRLHLNYRTPNKQTLEWAQRIVDAMESPLPKNTTEVYAREALLLHERQSTDVVVQAIRIGDFALATTPNETYALTGLKIKAHSPLQPTVVFDLTNGGDGYIPPPEQHLLGGYNTWPARSAGLEVEAERKIAEAALLLLENVSGAPRREHRLPSGPAAQAIFASHPDAYYRLDEFGGPAAADSSGHHRDAIFEPRIAYFLDGPHPDLFCAPGILNRSIHCAGDRLRASLPGLETDYSVSLWFWNGMPPEGREVTGWLLSRSHDHGLSHGGDHLGLAGTALPEHTGKIIAFHGTDDQQIVVGRTPTQRWTWHHLALVRQGQTLRAYLDGKLEIETATAGTPPPNLTQFFFGGRSDQSNNFEGRLDELALYRRALTLDEIRSLANPH